MTFTCILRHWEELSISNSGVLYSEEYLFYWVRIWMATCYIVHNYRNEFQLTQFQVGLYSETFLRVYSCRDTIRMFRDIIMKRSLSSAPFFFCGEIVFLLARLSLYLDIVLERFGYCHIFNMPSACSSSRFIALHL